MTPIVHVFYGRLALATLLFVGAIYLMEQSRAGWGWALLAAILVTPFWSPRSPCKCDDED